MNGSEVLLAVGGGVALLLWGVRMVRTAIGRAFGAELRRVLAVCGRNRFLGFGAGLGVTAVLQSSTATALIVASFAGRGLIATVPALAVMLGADVGTTVAAQILSLPVQMFSPALVLAGVVLFMATSAARPRNMGRLLLGLGLMLLALRQIVAATEPLRDSQGLATILEMLHGEGLIAILVAAILTWLAHSSLAVVLLVMSLSASGVLPLEVALALVLGANVGGALAPVMATAGTAPPARRAPMGNLLMRLAGAVVALPLLPLIQPLLAHLSEAPARQVVNFHTGFNLAVALLMLPLIDLVARLVERLYPEAEAAEDPSRPRHLDQAALDSPADALACAAREAMRMGDHVERMLERTMRVFETDDARLAREVESEDDVVDALHEAIKLYLAQLNRQELDGRQGARSVEILVFTTNLEHAGDIIDKNLMELAAKKIRNKLRFSPAGLAEIREFHALILENLRRSLNLFVSGDVELARELVSRKVVVRAAERDATQRHLERLGAGRPETIQSSSLHLDILRDLKRINSHLTSVAYPVLERTGELRRAAREREAAAEALAGDSGPG
ncbi:Na/Pi cotransporter family protein [Geminicoccaceae bacterium 1502E]|nr:Na/Pi cotransporter family protein [Geminicoccaceae bacterium 1502E]